MKKNEEILDNIEFMEEHGRKDGENISVDRGMSLFAIVGTFEIPYEDELDYERFNKIKVLPVRYSKDTPFHKKNGGGKIE